MPGRLEGQVALITGAARGQGRSHAIRLAEEGANIIAVDICAQVDTVPFPMATPADLAETIRQVEAIGRQIVAAEADVRDYGALSKVVDHGVAELGRLDIVAANAGIVSFGLVHELSEETWRDQIDTNLIGVWHTVKAAVPHMIAGGRGGSIVLTGSVAGLKGVPGIGHYVAAKHGLTGLMKTMAIEFAPHRIRVNSVNPTQVDTPMLRNEASFRLFAPDKEEPTIEDVRPVSQAMNLLPIPWVEAVDLSNAIVFLSSQEGRYITGLAMTVDAGSLIK
jgi:(+)-trans-carveol dehydrogenase